jgi:hypothetical protein
MIKTHLQAYETYDKSLALVGYDVVPESPLDEQTIHDALLAFANAGQTQLPAITSFRVGFLNRPRCRLEGLC